jgi:D-amino-acid dehydrogenase
VQPGKGYSITMPRPAVCSTTPLIFPEAQVAAGHNMLGLSMAPATGRLITECVSGETPHLDPRPYRLGRI